MPTPTPPANRNNTVGLINVERGRKLLTEDNFTVVKVREAKDPIGVTNTAVEILIDLYHGNLVPVPQHERYARKIVHILRPDIKEALKALDFSIEFDSNGVPVFGDISIIEDKDAVIALLGNIGIAIELDEFDLIESSNGISIKFRKDALSYTGTLTILSLLDSDDEDDGNNGDGEDVDPYPIDIVVNSITSNGLNVTANWTGDNSSATITVYDSNDLILDVSSIDNGVAKDISTRALIEDEYLNIVVEETIGNGQGQLEFQVVITP